jgi:hypothetical protein
MIKLATPSLRFIVYLLAAVLLAALATVLFGAHSGTAIAGAAAIPALGEVRVVVPDEEDYRHWGGHNELLQRWWRRVIEAAGSSSRLTEAERLVEAETKIDFANWLHGYVATAFYAAYERAESQWRLYAGVKELRDFKELRIKGRNRLQGFGYIGDHAHMPGMRRSYRPEASLFLDTYGAMHELTRQAIINQETDEILRDDPQDMGTAAAEYLANAIVALMTSNPTAPDGDPFYSLARGNLTTAEVSAASLMAAWTAFQTRKDETGLPIRITPRRLIVQNRTIGAIALRTTRSRRCPGPPTSWSRSRSCPTSTTPTWSPTRTATRRSSSGCCAARTSSRRSGSRRPRCSRSGVAGRPRPTSSASARSRGRSSGTSAFPRSTPTSPTPGGRPKPCPRSRRTRSRTSSSRTGARTRPS